MPRFLITEALRGDGAYLRSCDGERFMLDAHSLAELAPRDVVSREMVKAMKRCSGKPVYLDATHITKERLIAKFPTIWSHCMNHGIDISRDLIPVRPTAHYTIGGIKTDINGKSSIDRLYAIGEVSCTGVHGANRLASNSLLEGLVFGKRVANDIQKTLKKDKDNSVEVVNEVFASNRNKADVDWGRERRWLQDIMTEHVGLSRSPKSLECAMGLLDNKAEIESTQADIAEGFEFKNMLHLARLVVRAALSREESRGVHYREDFPESSDEWLLNQDFSVEE
ncbi:MAG: FAD-binding protein [Rubrobacteridae bacterium]|nr:FAD-binding protein [Rubrobacteridae bacterium]